MKNLNCVFESFFDWLVFFTNLNEEGWITLLKFNISYFNCWSCLQGCVFWDYALKEGKHLILNLLVWYLLSSTIQHMEHLCKVTCHCCSKLSLRASRLTIWTVSIRIIADVCIINKHGTCSSSLARNILPTPLFLVIFNNWSVNQS